MTIKLILIRHGATNSNECGKYLGQIDESLSEYGRQELRQKIREGWYSKAEFIAASPMKRCLETAEQIYQGNPGFLTEKWMEIDFGRFEGKNYTQLKEDTAYQKWIDSNGTLSFPEGESKQQFIARSVFGFTDFCHVLSQVKPLPKTAAMVVHGGTIMAILSSFTKQDYFHYQCKNAEGYICELELSDSVRIRQIKKLKGQ